MYRKAKLARLDAQALATRSSLLLVIGLHVLLEEPLDESILDPFPLLLNVGHLLLLLGLLVLDVGINQVLWDGIGMVVQAIEQCPLPDTRRVAPDLDSIQRVDVEETQLFPFGLRTVAMKNLAGLIDGTPHVNPVEFFDSAHTELHYVDRVAWTLTHFRPTLA